MAIDAKGTLLGIVIISTQSSELGRLTTTLLLRTLCSLFCSRSCIGRCPLCDTPFLSRYVQRGPPVCPGVLARSRDDVTMTDVPVLNELNWVGANSKFDYIIHAQQRIRA